MMKIKTIPFMAAALALVMTLGVSAASAGASSSSAASSAPSASAPGHHGFGAHGGGDFGALKALSALTGISVEELHSKYPQKTAWQIAKQLDKLDALKKAYLSNQKERIDKIVGEGKITADEGAKIYADIQKRVAAIDGVNTVTLGRPGYRPEHKAAASSGK